MNIAQALKKKNRLTGELTRLQAIFQSSNSQDSRQAPPVMDSGAAFEKIAETIKELVELKGRIAAANIGIYKSIELMAQNKSLLSQVNSLPVNESKGNKVHPYDKESKETYDVTCFINGASKEVIRAELQKSIEELQDLIDDYNAKTQV